MANCPKCRAEMGATEAVCSSCGYDFPEDVAPRREGFAYTAFADLALIVSMVAAGLGSLMAVYFAVMNSILGKVVPTLTSFVAFFLLLGMLIVFMRVSDLKK